MTKNALLSVYDKTGIIELAKGLIDNGFRIISTGGTAKILKNSGIKVTGVSEFTGFPEVFGGRVKTLHPAVFGGLLFRSSSEEDKKQAKENKISRIGLIAVNFYPFEEAAQKARAVSSISPEIIENIDIGGVALLRAAAKNFEDVIALCDPADYNSALEIISAGKPDAAWRMSLAAKAFRCTAYYDSLIAEYFSGRGPADFDEKFPVALKKISSLRYGENPHQKAALYAIPLAKGIAAAKQLQGKELSYNNYLDIEAAWNAVSEFDSPACVIVKHTNPCGAAMQSSEIAVPHSGAAQVKDKLAEAYRQALSCDPVSAFGGIAAFNRKVDAVTASEVVKLFTECVIAPGFDDDAKKIFSVKKDLRLMEFPLTEKSGRIIELRSISGGILVQEKDTLSGFENIRTVTKSIPGAEIIESFKFAWKAAKNVKSNAIVLVKGQQTVGIGAGQMSRIDSIKIAAAKMEAVKLPVEVAQLPLVMASDAFFPFRDVVDAAAKIGVTAIIQPGGSLRDEESVKACNEHGIAMLFTGVRHFKH